MAVAAPQIPAKPFYFGQKPPMKNENEFIGTGWGKSGTVISKKTARTPMNFLSTPKIMKLH